jgi:GDSL-like Lipase/Acylhydrolase family
MSSENIERKKKKRRELRAKLLLMLGSILVCIAFIEVGLRIAGYSFPEFYLVDAHRGYALRPGMEGWYRKETKAFVRINGDGLRDREHSIAKPPNTLRIAVLGDSYTEAFQVAFESSFCAMLEKKLRECAALSGRNVEVINFGVSGYGTAQELITLRENVWRYSPDVVLLAVTTNNDISDNVRALKKTDQIPYFIWRDGRLVEDDSFAQTKTFKLRASFLGSLGRWFQDHLRIVQGVTEAQRGFKVLVAAWKARHAQQNSSGYPSLLSPGDQSQSNSNQNATPQARPPGGVALADELGVDNVIYREPSDPVWNDAWHVTEGLIDLIRDEVQRKGAKLLVVTLSNGIQVWPDALARQSFLQRVGARDIFYPDTRIRQICERQHIPVANLAPTMQKYAEANHVFLHGFGKEIGNGHWNENGHRIAGELTAAKLCELLR